MLCMSSLSCVSSVLCVGDGLAVYEYSLTLQSTMTTPTHTDSLLIHHSYALPDSHPCSNSRYRQIDIVRTGSHGLIGG